MGKFGDMPHLPTILRVSIGAERRAWRIESSGAPIRKYDCCRFVHELVCSRMAAAKTGPPKLCRNPWLGTRAMRRGDDYGFFVERTFQ
jgi:hypothetical protein